MLPAKFHVVSRLLSVLKIEILSCIFARVSLKVSSHNVFSQ